LRNELELGESGAMRREVHLKELFQTLLDFCGRSALHCSADTPIDQRANPSSETIQGAKRG